MHPQSQRKLLKYFLKYSDFVLGAPEKPFTPIMNTNQQEDADQGPINTNTYLVARYLKSADGKMEGHALGTLSVT